jgi:hypothetical protein
MDRNSSHLRGLPPDNLLREVRNWHGARLRIGQSEEDVIIHRLITTVFQIEQAQKRQLRGRGNQLDCQVLREALGFLYKHGLPLRSSYKSPSVLDYGEELARTEPLLKNPRATARSRMRRLTDLRRKQGFPVPKPGRRK